MLCDLVVRQGRPITQLGIRRTKFPIYPFGMWRVRSIGHPHRVQQLDISRSSPSSQGFDGMIGLVTERKDFYKVEQSELRCRLSYMGAESQ